MTPDQRFVQRWSQKRQTPIWWYALRFGLIVTAILTAFTFVLDYAIDRVIEPVNMAKFGTQLMVRVVIFSLGGAWDWYMKERRYQRLIR